MSAAAPRTGRLARLQDVALALTAADAGEAAHVIVTQVVAVLGGVGAMLATLDPTGRTLELRAAAGLSASALDSWRRFPLDSAAPLAEVVRTGEARWPETAAQRAARYPHLQREYGIDPHVAWLSLPLGVRGRIIGGLSVSFRHAPELDEEDRTLALAVGALCAAALERERLHQAEQEARAAADAARDALSRTRLTLEALIAEAPLAIIVSRPDGTVRLWNPAAERIFGWRADEVIGRCLPTVPEELRDGVLAALRQAIDGSVRRGIEALRRRKDGSTVEVALWSAPLTGGGLGDEPAVLTMMADVTEQAAARRDLERLAAQLQAALNARDEFLSVAAHELKTPITTLRAHTQVALRRLERDGALDPTRVRHTFEVIDGETARLARLTERLLDVTRIQRGRLEIEPRPTDVAALARRAAESAQARTERHHVRVTTPPTPVTDQVDPLRLEQVLANLLDNAIKYSPDGGPIDVTVDAATPGRLRIAVRDRGIGVPPEARDRIFESFFQAHPHAHYGGMGLGLHISREIVTLHGGTLTHEQPDGPGACFVVSLPTQPS